jgi:hypothetical protein
MSMTKNRICAVLIVAAGLFAGSVQAQDPAGRVLWLFGKVERVSAGGVATSLSRGDAVFEGDVIRTAAASHAQLMMSDQALIAVRPESSLQLSSYVYQGREDGTERAVIDLLKGGMRSVTGAVGRSHKENYRIRTKTSSIGIRGTDHETYATEEGTYNRVTVGGTYLQSPGGRIDLSPGQAGFASFTPGAAPLRLDRTPEFMHLAALRSGDTGPQPREASAGDARRLDKGVSHGNAKGASHGNAGLPVQAASPVLPSQALGENAHQRGYGNGGRCGGPCPDPLKNQENGKGKAKP